MTTTPQDALEKIRRQIQHAEHYVVDSPEWEGAKEVLRILRAREEELTDNIQAEILKQGINKLKGEQWQV